MMENREFYIDKDGFRIHAKLDFPEGRMKPEEGTVPEGQGRQAKENGEKDPAGSGHEDTQGEKLPLVIVVHGITGNMEETHIRTLSAAARQAGMATLRVELYGHGKTDGAFRNHNLLEWVSELIYVIDYAKALPFVSDICLMGHSQGGLAVMLAGALKQDQVKAILPLSPAIVIRDGCRDGNLLGHRFDPDRIPDELDVGDSHFVTGNYIRTGRTLPVEQAIDAYRGPVLIVHGTADDSVPVKDSLRAADRYANAQLVLVPGDDHCYRKHLDFVTEAVREFLAEL